MRACFWPRDLVCGNESKKNIPATIYNAAKKQDLQGKTGDHESRPFTLSGAIPIQPAGTRTLHSSKEARVPELAIGLYILGLLFIGDIVSTEYILVRGGHELNQYMIPFVEDPLLHAVVKLLALCIIALVAIYTNKKVPRAGSILVIAVIVLYAVVVLSNMLIILRILWGSPV